MKETDIHHLKWIYQRMVMKHKENEDYDYMIKFRSIPLALRQSVVMGSGNPKCPKCNDRAWLYDEQGNRAGICHCHYP